jgi:hypothetical protein
MKYRKLASLLILLILGSIKVKGQSYELYMPRNIQVAYKNGTRNFNGLPGNKYWQNRSSYKIQVKLDTASKRIEGKMTVIYFNHSPYRLENIVFRFYQDIFKRGAIRDRTVDPQDIHNGTEIRNMTLDGKKVDIKNPFQFIDNGTNKNLILDNEIEPGKSVEITMEWAYKIPENTHIREGIYGKSSYFIAYWYPQIAVYDDIDGWDDIQYTGTQEFYNDINDYEVEITVPKNFIVWSTGTLQNAEQVLEKKYLDRLKRSMNTDSVVRIIDKADLSNPAFTVNKPEVTWIYKAEKVPDFTFACSNAYLWDASSTVVDAAGRRVSVAAAYNEFSHDFYEVAAISRDVIKYFSTEFPAVPYPYPQLTVFNGHGGMEFPMMVNDGTVPSRGEAVYVTAHEIAHTYFPFYMGINERKYAWMDEGWAQMLPYVIIPRLAPDYDLRQNDVQIFTHYSGREMELPLMIPSNQITGVTYGMSSYFRPAAAYTYLKEMFGEEKFAAMLRKYMETWNGKHPIPYDFFNFFNTAAETDLNWYWNPWFFQPGYADLEIKTLTQTKSDLSVLITNNGTLPVPVVLTVTYSDGSKEVFSESAAVWKNGGYNFLLRKKIKKQVVSARVGDKYVTDINTENNQFIVK